MQKTVKTPNFVLTEAFQISYSVADTKTLPAGSFVRPIEYKYVPKHVIDSPHWKWFNKEVEVFAYTRLGIVAIPKRIIRET